MTLYRFYRAVVHAVCNRPTRPGDAEKLAAWRSWRGNAVDDAFLAAVKK